MKKKLLPFLFLFFLLIGTVNAGHNWNRINYMHSTIFTAYVFLDGKPASEGDVVGAFVNGECRMIKPIFINNDTAFVSSVIHGDKADEVNFKIWVKSEDKVYDLDEKLTLKPDESIHMFSLSKDK